MPWEKHAHQKHRMEQHASIHPSAWQCHYICAAPSNPHASLERVAAHTSEAPATPRATCGGRLTKQFLVLTSRTMARTIVRNRQTARRPLLLIVSNGVKPDFFCLLRISVGRTRGFRKRKLWFPREPGGSIRDSLTRWLVGCVFFCVSRSVRSGGWALFVGTSLHCIRISSPEERVVCLERGANPRGGA